MEVGRRQLDACIEHVEEVVGDDAFHYVVVAEAEADPEAVELGAAEESFALGFEIVGKFADEVDGLHVVEGEGAVLAVQGEQIDWSRSGRGSWGSGSRAWACRRGEGRPPFCGWRMRRRGF